MDKRSDEDVRLPSEPKENRPTKFQDFTQKQKDSFKGNQKKVKMTIETSSELQRVLQKTKSISQFEEVLERNCHPMNSNRHESLSQTYQNLLFNQLPPPKESLQSVIDQRITIKRTSHPIIEDEPVPSATKATKKAQQYYRRIQQRRQSKKDFTSSEFLAVQPYHCANSLEFFKAVKEDQMIKVRNWLFDQPLLVKDTDTTFMTALHWACKLGLVDMARMLLEHPQDIDATDLIGRSPLYFAVLADCPEMVQLVLCKRASPWSKVDDMNVLDVNMDNKHQLVIEFLIKSARKSSICLAMIGDKTMREKVWLQDRKLLEEPIRKLKSKYQLY